MMRKINIIVKFEKIFFSEPNLRLLIEWMETFTLHF